MLQSRQKRQTFRLSIRNKQIQQKFTQIRNKHNNLLLHPTVNYHLTPILTQHYNTIQQNIIILLNTVQSKIKQHGYQQLLQVVSYFQMYIQEQRNSYLNNNCNSNSIQYQWRKMVSICVSQAVGKYGRRLLQLGKVQLLGMADDKDDKYEGQDQNDSTFLFNQNINKQLKQPLPMQYRIKISLLHKYLQILSHVLPNILNIFARLRILYTLWQSFKHIQVPISKSNTIQQQYQKDLYLQIIYILLDYINNMCPITQTYSSKQYNTLKEQIKSMGIIDGLRFIIDYVVQCQVVIKDWPNRQDMQMKIINMIEIHLRIIQLLQKYYLQTQQYNNSNKQQNIAQIQNNLQQHYASYLLFLISTYHKNHIFSTVQIIPKLQLYIFYTLNLILSNNIHIISCIDNNTYIQIFHILKIYVEEANQQAWTQIKKYIIATIIRIIEIATEKCQIVVGKLVGLRVLDQIERVIIKIGQIYDNQQYKYNNISEEHIKQILQIISKTLTNILANSSTSTKKLIKSHSIMPIIFQLLPKYTLRLFPLFSIFQSYFIRMGSKVTISQLHILLQNVNLLQLSQSEHGKRQEFEEVKKILQNIYYGCESYMDQEGMERIWGMYKMYGLEAFVDAQTQYD